MEENFAFLNHNLQQASRTVEGDILLKIFEEQKKATKCGDPYREIIMKKF